ncbi:unnamed protein product, partial [Boreogadus saida]
TLLCAESRAGVADEGRQGLRRRRFSGTKNEEEGGRLRQGGGRAGKGPEMWRRLEDFARCLVWVLVRVCV